MRRLWSEGTMRGGSATWAHRRAIALVVALVTASSALLAVIPAQPASSLNGSDFEAGYIISDELFYDGSAMSSADIQSFLDSKIGSCQNGNCLNVAVVPVTSQPASYGSRTGDLICSAIAGGNLRVSELIFRTQAACGISAKAILVTLQKEQGLVTSRAPSATALERAMGMACPDTAPCDQAFAGLATQIMTGTHQLKYYKANAYLRQPGLNYIQYSPNASCGGTNVNILGYATAALYNYTPYQPDDAALANLGGTGDGCSSYGNRNFWWYYNSWFGSSIQVPCTVNPNAEITRYWSSQGGATGTLGAAVSPGIVPGPAGTTIGYFAGGDIYCTPRIGAVAVVGDVLTKYDSMGGAGSALGAPLSPRTAFSAGGVTGFLQEFQAGTMMSSTSTGTFPVLYGPMRDAWGARGGSGGSLGWPTGDPLTVSGGLRQQFQNGVIMVPTGQAAIILNGEIGRYWATGSNTTILGSPTSAATILAAGGVSGILQYFDRGMVLSSTTTGTFAVLNGSIRTAWGASGGAAGSLGWPIADQKATTGGVQQDFQGGTVYGSDSGVGSTMSGPIATYWGTGTNAALLGFPTGAASALTARKITGNLQYFERGMVLSSTSTGTHAVLNGQIRDAWGASGGSGGTFGWPTGDQQTSSGQLRQQFQGGLLTAGTSLTGAIATYWSTGSNASRLGTATSPATSYSAGGVTGTLQYFQWGMVLSSAETGTFAVLTGPIRNAWGAAGGSGGSVGWPTGDQQAVPGGSQQQFQRGIIMVPTGGAGGVLSGDIGTYWAAGSHSTQLGLPTSSAAPLSAGGVSGSVQYFQSGLVLSSSSTGTFAVLNGQFRNTWGASGGTGGTLGWPTADQTAMSGGMQQKFQRGAVIVPTGGAGLVLSGAIGQYWSTGSNSTRLGQPTSSPLPLSGNGVTGTYQVFQLGMVLSSSSTGTFAVLNGLIRKTWGALNGSAGTLGWPTGDQTAVSGGVSQQFQLGTITIEPDGTPITLTGALYTYWSTGSNATVLGAPTAPLVIWSAGNVSGSYQVFENGMVMSSVTTGTFAVLNGPIRSVWGGLGGSGGSLGWPTGDQHAVTGGTQQQFQHGYVMVPTSGAAYAVQN